MDRVNTPFKMEDTIKGNGKIVKCMELEDYIINRKILPMMDNGIEANFRERERFIINIL